MSEKAYPAYAYRRLVAKIILLAIKDYLQRPQQRATIARFFNSDWGKYLCSLIELNSASILEQLKAIVREGKERDVKFYLTRVKSL